MVARELRLRSASDFDRVRTRGRTVSSRWFVVKALPNDLGHNRYGFAAGKRFGNAVQRNRAKRLMREVLRELHPHLAQGFDIVVIVRNNVPNDLTYAHVRPDIAELLRRVGLYHEALPCVVHSSG